MAIRYINTDLDVQSSSDLGDVVKALGEELLVLHHGPTDDGQHHASFEINEDADDPETTVLAFLTIIESLEGELREAWDNSERKVLDMGFEGGEQSEPYRHEMEAHTMRRIAELGVSIAVTIYSPDPTLPDPSGKNGKT